jgi:hypothetical protein
MKSSRFLIAALVLLAATAGCNNKGPAKPSDIEAFSCDSMDKVVAGDQVSFDKDFSADGKGSLKITVEQPATVPLFEVPAPGAENAKYVFKAQVNMKDLLGDASLQMKIQFKSGGEVNAYQTTKGTGAWTPMETFGIVQKGQKPDTVKLYLLVNGTGTCWVDDVHLVQVPLH